MKKTIIALLSLAGAAVGADFTTEELWRIDFGSEYTNGYQITTGTYDYKPGPVYDVDGCIKVAGGIEANGVDKRPQFVGDTGLTWNDDFQFTITFTMPEGNFTGSSNWPVLACIGSQSSLRFGPYLNESNQLHVDGSVTTTTDKEVVLTSGQHTAIITVIDREVTLTLDNDVAIIGTLKDSVTGSITDIKLGGGEWSSGAGYQNYLGMTVHDVTMSKIIPEPATATLSLLALAGLCARRRRG